MLGFFTPRNPRFFLQRFLLFTFILHFSFVLPHLRLVRWDTGDSQAVQVNVQIITARSLALRTVCGSYQLWSRKKNYSIYLVKFEFAYWSKSEDETILRVHIEM